MKDMMRSGATEDALDEYIQKIFLVKSKYKKDSPSAGHIEMSSRGG
jgi:hypothetical protein